MANEVYDTSWFGDLFSNIKSVGKKTESIDLIIDFKNRINLKIKSVYNLLRNIKTF